MHYLRPTYNTKQSEGATNVSVKNTASIFRADVLYMASQEDQQGNVTNIPSLPVLTAILSSKRNMERDKCSRTDEMKPRNT